MLYRAGVPRHAIIKKLAGEDITKLQDFINVLSSLSKGARVPLEYISYTDRHRRKSVLVTVDRHEWYAAPQIYTRDDNSGIWIGKPALGPGPGPTSQLAANGVASMEESDSGTKKQRVGEDSDSDSNELSIESGNASVAERVIEPTLVMFEVKKYI